MGINELIEALIKRGQQRGFLTAAEVQQDLEDAEAAPESFDLVFERLSAAKVKVSEDGAENFLVPFSEDDHISLSDPVRMYAGNRTGCPPDVSARGRVGDGH